MSIFKDKKFLLTSFVSEYSEVGAKHSLLQVEGDTDGDGKLSVQEQLALKKAGKDTTSQVNTTSTAAQGTGGQGAAKDAGGQGGAPDKPSSVAEAGQKLIETGSKELKKATELLEQIEQLSSQLSASGSDGLTLEDDTWTALKTQFPGVLQTREINANILKTLADNATKRLDNANLTIDKGANLLGGGYKADKDLEAAQEQASATKANAAAAVRQALATEEQAKAQRYTAEKQYAGQLIGITQTEYQAKLGSELRVYDQINADLADPAKEKSAQMLGLRMYKALMDSNLMPTINVTIADDTGKIVDRKEIPMYSALRITDLAYEREVKEAGKFSTLQYFYVPETAVANGNRLVNGDLINIDEKSPLVSEVSKVFDGPDKYHYVDKKTGQVLNNEQMERVFAKASAFMSPQLLNGQVLKSYLQPAEGDDGADKLYREALPNKAQALFSYTGKMFPNEMYRHELAEFISGIGQMGMFEIIIRAIALLKGGKDFGIAGKGGNKGSMEPAKVFDSQDVTYKASQVAGAKYAQDGVAPEDFAKELEKLKEDMKKAGVDQKTIDLTLAGTTQGYREFTQQEAERKAQLEAEKQGLFAKLKVFFGGGTPSIKNGKGEVTDEITGPEEDQVRNLLKEYEGVATNLGIDVTKLKDVTDISARQEKDGSYKVELYSGTGKGKKLQEDFTVTK